MQHLDWQFSKGLSVAVETNSAEKVQFTRAERAMLQAFMSYKDRIWTRDTLLDAVFGVDC